MASTSATLAKALVVALLLIQCCNVIDAARLLEGDAGWLQGLGDAGELLMEVLPKGPSGPGGSNGCTHDPNHPPAGKCWP